MLKIGIPGRDPATFLNNVNKNKKKRDRKKNWLIP